MFRAGEGEEGMQVNAFAWEFFYHESYQVSCGR
jgi:hypothetical protein